MRNFEVIGEATKHLSDAFRTSHSNIEWKKIAGLRDKLIHDYMGIDLWSIWVLATEMIPDFSTEIKKIISGEED
ncbi:MAG: DUF86 domain-containing protein [Chitinophagaceae bacterium]|nr:DUF86 domain-containing protein [Chitinophagaceae bacterium]